MTENRTSRIIRMLDLIIAVPVVLILVSFMPFLVCMGTIFFRNPIFVQNRVGRQGTVFKIFKFRTLPDTTPELPTHLLPGERETDHWYGRILRRTKIDELPQVLNVIIGSMSWVGPRPCLVSQVELISLRRDAGLHKMVPGVTGMPQLCGFDMKDPKRLVEIEQRYFLKLGAKGYLYTIALQIKSIFVRLNDLDYSS